MSKFSSKIIPVHGLPKAVVVHAGARDHYQLAAALHEADLLDTLVTDVYGVGARDGRLPSAVRNNPLTKLLAKRSCAGLDGANVKISVRALGATALMKAWSGANTNRYKDKVLSRTALRVAERKGSALFCYSYYASEAFALGRQSLRHRFIFQLHPHPQTVRALLEDEMHRVPRALASLQDEHELSLGQKDFETLCDEPRLANGWVVASSYTARTLVEHGVARGRIHVVPYGVDNSKFVARRESPGKGELFRIVFVGSMRQRKGLSYLLDAARLLRSRRIKVVLCGRGMVDRRLLDDYKDLDLEINVGLKIEDLIRQLHSADVFVLPSLAEGFAHVLLEAMSCGVPVITTPHTCAGDVLVDGVHGFTVPIRDADAIAEKLAWGIENRDELAEMGRAAAAQAGGFTWERFRAGVRDAYREMVIATA